MGQLFGPILVSIFNGLDQLMMLIRKFGGKGVSEGAEMKPQHALTIIKKPGIEKHKIRIISGLADGNMKIAVGFDHRQHVAIGNGFIELSLLVFDVLKVLIHDNARAAGIIVKHDREVRPPMKPLEESAKDSLRNILATTKSAIQTILSEA